MIHGGGIGAISVCGNQYEKIILSGTFHLEAQTQTCIQSLCENFPLGNVRNYQMRSSRFEKFKVLSIRAVIWERFTNLIVICILSAASRRYYRTMERYIPSLDGLRPQLMSHSESSEIQSGHYPMTRKNSREQHHNEHQYQWEIFWREAGLGMATATMDIKS